MANFEHAFDDRAESFLQVGSIAAKIATFHSGVVLDEQTTQRWQELMGLLREVDTLVDDTSISNVDMVSELRNFNVFANRYPQLTPEQLGQDVQTDLLTRVDRILKLGSEVATTTNVAHFIGLRIVEGRETANLLYDAAKPTVKHQPAFYDNFMPVIRSLAVTANLIDSITDAKKDYIDKKVILRPSAEYYRSLIEQTPRHAALGATALMHVSVLNEFATMSWNRLINRVKHRDSNTTSLNLFKN